MVFIKLVSKAIQQCVQILNIIYNRGLAEDQRAENVVLAIVYNKILVLFVQVLLKNLKCRHFTSWA